MNVVFADQEAYFDELRGIPDPTTSGIVVRSSIQSESIASGGGDRYTVVSGFHDDKYFYEARIDCGEMFKGDKTTGARGIAESLLEEIRAVCEEVGIEHKGGLWHRPE